MTDLVGKKLDVYEIVRLIGEGGMGSVYEARHSVIGKRCAIKTLNKETTASEELVARMIREAQAASAIGHPNIIDINDFRQDPDGTYFMVMELLSGETLSSVIMEHGKLAVNAAVAVMVQVLSALIAAHRKGIIHRDLKPDNIFIAKRRSGDYQVKILDFGVSKFLTQGADNLQLTKTGSVLGTPYYMSPEQAAGKRDIDQRTDLWSCGAILYETLTGIAPFRGESYNEVIAAILLENYQPPKKLRPELPDGLVTVVEKALQKHKAERHATASEFLGQLAPYYSSSDVEVGRFVLRRSLFTADPDLLAKDADPKTAKVQDSLPPPPESEPTSMPSIPPLPDDLAARDGAPPGSDAADPEVHPLRPDPSQPFPLADATEKVPMEDPRALSGEHGRGPVTGPVADGTKFYEFPIAMSQPPLQKSTQTTGEKLSSKSDIVQATPINRKLLYSIAGGMCVLLAIGIVVGIVAPSEGPADADRKPAMSGTKETTPAPATTTTQDAEPSHTEPVVPSETGDQAEQRKHRETAPARTRPTAARARPDSVPPRKTVPAAMQPGARPAGPPSPRPKTPTATMAPARRPRKPPAMITIKLRGLPAKAKVQLDNRNVRLPLRIRADGKKHCVKARAPGRRLFSKCFVAKKNQNILVKMPRKRRIIRPRPRRHRPRPRPRRSREFPWRDPYESS